MVTEIPWETRTDPETGERLFRLVIKTDNEAFARPYVEVARILRDVADLLEVYEDGAARRIRDANGNTVGQFDWTRDG